MFIEKTIALSARSDAPETRLFCKLAQKEKITFGSRPVMMLVPGGPGGNHHVYLPLADLLLTFADLIFFDPRGCGNSKASDARYCTLDHYIEDIEAIRRYFNLARILLLGGSYGAIASLGYAIRYPDRLEKLILLGGAPSFRFIDTAKKNLAKRGNDKQRRMAHKLFDGEFQDAHDFAEFYRIMATLYSTTITSAPPTTSAGVPYNIEVTNLGFKTWLRTFDFENQLHKISCPSLIISGDQDWINDACHAREMAAKIPKAELHIFENCGHFAEIDQPEKFNDTVRRFLA